MSKSKDPSQKIQIVNFTYIKKGETYTAVRVNAEQLRKAGKSRGCNCGDESCEGGWVWRCMAGGGGECEWYATNEVC
jgi:hypothetical protein